MANNQGRESSITPNGEFITLQQLLKLTGEISMGGEVREYLAEVAIYVNGELEDRRGRKLRPGDEVLLPGKHTVYITG